MLQRWFPGWISGVPVQPIEETDGGGRGEGEQTAAAPLAGREEDELLLELGYEEDAGDVLLRDRTLLELSFTLMRGSFKLVATPDSPGDFFGPRPLIELSFRALCFSADLRPRTRSATFDLSLGSLCAVDLMDSESLFPVLVQPKGAKVREGEGGREGGREVGREGGRWEGREGGGRVEARVGGREGGREGGGRREGRWEGGSEGD